jgi:DNA helicase HerA-like ATPase
LMGISGAGGLREVLARLDTKQQAILMGHAVPMPVVVKTRAYDLEFYQAVSPAEPADQPRPRLGSPGRKRLG